MAQIRPSSRLPGLKRKASSPLRRPRQTFPFLRLPRELRDEIYQYVLLGRSAALSTSKGQSLTTTSPLTAVNEQICEEFNDALLFYSETITTNVRNYSFAHIVTFLNRLSEAQVARLASCPSKEASQATSIHKATPSPERTIRITLSFTPKAKNCRTNLNRWLDRFDVEGKRGSEIMFEYDADIQAKDGSYKNRPYRRTTASQRWTEEARKIEEACQAGRRGRGMYN
ncbi:hypothetical protein DOTSEDRAFT_66509 [Dothistroma septosporum NZE10]|uniref:Uncharacterized protein n=1 Tax=Dothistroma septosporum (strain NZE10 / CBS 128990) TaxID=675120 RepID=M2YKZ5_DOTSN|nr:hypothetical protein DOTSEDRAFT_66509 [Dothistroma septosporum NZE10]